MNGWMDDKLVLGLLTAIQKVCALLCINKSNKVAVAFMVKPGI
jgi:hypothetical protein